jgi:hypothetical protein
MEVEQSTRCRDKIESDNLGTGSIVSATLRGLSLLLFYAKPRTCGTNGDK